MIDSPKAGFLTGQKVQAVLDWDVGYALLHACFMCLVVGKERLANGRSLADDGDAGVTLRSGDDHQGGGKRGVAVREKCGASYVAVRISFCFRTTPTALAKLERCQ